MNDTRDSGSDFNPYGFLETLPPDDPMAAQWLAAGSRLQETDERLRSAMLDDPQRSRVELALDAAVNQFSASIPMTLALVTSYESARECARTIHATVERYIEVFETSGLQPQGFEVHAPEFKRRLMVIAHQAAADAWVLARKAEEDLAAPNAPISTQATCPGDIAVLMNHQGKLKQWANKKDAAAYLGVCERTLERYIKDAKVTAKGDKGKRMISVESLVGCRPPENTTASDT